MGDNPWAMVENLIKECVKARKRISRSDLYKAVHAERSGLQIFNRALDLLEQEGSIRIEPHQTGSKGGRKKQIIVWCGE